jgi:hypothetical protein
LQVRGKAIYPYETLDVMAGNTDAQNAVTIDLPYVGNYFEAISRAAMWYHRLASTDMPRLDAVNFYADYNSTYMGYAQTGKIGQPFTVTETATGMSTKKYFINYRKFKIDQGTLNVEWLGEPAENINYIQLDTTDKLDSTKVLA